MKSYQDNFLEAIMAAFQELEWPPKLNIMRPYTDEEVNAKIMTKTPRSVT